MNRKKIVLILAAIIVLVIACAAVIIDDADGVHILYRSVQVTATAIYAGAYPAPQISVVVDDGYPSPVEWYPPPVYEPTAYPAPVTSTPRPTPTPPPPPDHAGGEVRQ